IEVVPHLHAHASEMRFRQIGLECKRMSGCPPRHREALVEFGLGIGKPAAYRAGLRQRGPREREARIRLHCALEEICRPNGGIARELVQEIDSLKVTL